MGFGAVASLPNPPPMLPTADPLTPPPPGVLPREYPGMWEGGCLGIRMGTEMPPGSRPPPRLTHHYHSLNPAVRSYADPLLRFVEIFLRTGGWDVNAGFIQSVMGDQ